MTDPVWPISAAALLAACSLTAVAAFSLRDFSRGRLDELCKQRGEPERFSAILKHHADALLATEFWFTLLLLALTAICFEWNLERVVAAGDPTWSRAAGYGIVFASVILLCVVVLPWTVARVAGERFLAAWWPAIAAIRVIFSPLIAVAHRLDEIAQRAAGQEHTEEDDASAIVEEIQSVLDEGQREGIIESEAGSMIQRVIDLQKGEVSAIMTTRTEMVTLPSDATLDEARLKFLEVGHSRIPVVGETSDDVIGILYAKDLLRHLGQSHAAPPIREMVRQPLYVPETTGMDTLLETMKKDRVHFAIVVDEYGGVAGLVTMEDILEQIVGDIGDEHDSIDEEGVFPIEPGIIEVAAWVRIEDLNEQFGFDLPENDDYDTLGGFVFSQLGRIPSESESFPWKNLRFIVLAADRQRIDRLRIEVDKESPAAVAEEA